MEIRDLHMLIIYSLINIFKSESLIVLIDWLAEVDRANLYSRLSASGIAKFKKLNSYQF